MNERIRELEQVCWEELGEEEGMYPVFNTKKFAELIVKECIAQARISNSHGNNQWDKALTFAADNIKKHFGVEE